MTYHDKLCMLPSCWRTVHICSGAAIVGGNHRLVSKGLFFLIEGRRSEGNVNVASRYLGTLSIGYRPSGIVYTRSEGFPKRTRIVRLYLVYSYQIGIYYVSIGLRIFVFEELNIHYWFSEYLQTRFSFFPAVKRHMIWLAINNKVNPMKRPWTEH